MKPNTVALIVLSFLLATCMKAQVVFCPPGAKWTANYYGGIWSPYTFNESITYVRDTIEGQDTLKLLHHNKMYFSCNASGAILTAIKQKGDTIWFRNKYTSNQWQILINYACAVGQSWTTTVSVTSQSSLQTISYTVDSIKYVTENGLQLKQLYLKQQYNTSLYYVPSTLCSERYGWGFLFRFPGRVGACDGDGFLESLCYSDQQFGTKYFGAKACDYSNLLGLSERNDKQLVSVAPNPSSGSIVLKGLEVESAITIYNANGQAVLKLQHNNNLELDISELNDGIYFLRVENKGPIIRLLIEK